MQHHHNLNQILKWKIIHKLSCHLLYLTCFVFLDYLGKYKPLSFCELFHLKYPISGANEYVIFIILNMAAVGFFLNIKK